MAVKSRAVTVTTSATRLDSVDETDDTATSSLSLFNNGATTLYIGGADVSAANGVPVAAGSWGPGLNGLGLGEAVYGIAASGTLNVRVIETGV